MGHTTLGEPPLGRRKRKCRAHERLGLLPARLAARDSRLGAVRAQLAMRRCRYGDMHSHPTKQGLLAAYNVHEAKGCLSKLLARVEAGEQIVLCRDGRAIARLVPEVLPAEPQRRAGRARGQFTIRPDFDRAARIR